MYRELEHQLPGQRFRLSPSLRRGLDRRRSGRQSERDQRLPSAGAHEPGRCGHRPTSRNSTRWARNCPCPCAGGGDAALAALAHAPRNRNPHREDDLSPGLTGIYARLAATLTRLTVASSGRNAGGQGQPVPGCRTLAPIWRLSTLVADAPAAALIGPGLPPLQRAVQVFGFPGNDRLAPELGPARGLVAELLRVARVVPDYRAWTGKPA